MAVELRKGTHLLTFSSIGYESPERFLGQAQEIQFFDSVTVFSNKQIEELMRKRRFFFSLWKRKGFGFWIWKPRVVLQRLQEIPEGDYLIYLDQGFHIQKSGFNKLVEYLAIIESENKWIGVFSAGENYRPEFFVRKQVVQRHNPDFYSGNFGEYVYAGILIIKNGKNARSAIKEWQKICEETPIWAPIPFRVLQRKEFIGQDGDNGYLPVVLDKWGGYFKFPATETNIINHEGFQLHHVLPSADTESFEWSAMSEKPFLLKRDR